MPARVRVKIRSGRREAATAALLNTGFTSLEPEALVPKGLAERLDFWPPPENAILESLDTAGGEVLGYVIPNAVEITILGKSGSSMGIGCNAIISTYEKEVLLSDALMEEAGIEIISPKTGVWRFKGRAEEDSVEPEYW
jgi:hypothetical protein